MSGSVVALALNEQTMPAQLTVNDGTGGWLAGAPDVPGATTTENSCSPPPAALVVAVRLAAVPTPTAPLESASKELTLPPPVVAGFARVVLVAGLVQVWVTEDFSLQELTSQEPAFATATVGETWLVVEVVPAVCAEAVTDDAATVLR